MNITKHYFKTTTLITVILLCASVGSGQPISRLSIDFRAGMPSILSEASTPAVSPFGGLGARYSFNKYLSVSLDANGGVLSGKTTNGYYRNNFIQYGGKVHFNPTAFINNRSNTWKRFNVYLSFGANNMNYYYTLGQTSVNQKISRLYFLYDAGIAARYYCNEMVDFIAGTNFNFSETGSLDNVHDGTYDHFALTYIGLSLKILPYERKQLADWTHIDLPYSTGTMALTKQLVGNLEKDLKDQNKKGNDSITSVLRNEIKTVDDKVIKVDNKVDSVAAKLDLVLELLNKMNTQGVNVNQVTTTTTTSPETGTTITTKSAKQTVGTKPGQKKTVTTTTTITEEPAATNGTPSNGTIPAKKSTTAAQASSPSNTNQGTKAAYIDQNKVKENYAIVVGSFQVDDNAIRAREKYIEKGWDAHILGNAKSPYKRIVIFSNNYYEAAKIVTELRVTDQPDVWMLDINTGKGVFIK